jgi:hypothetical protein
MSANASELLLTDLLDFFLFSHYCGIDMIVFTLLGGVVGGVCCFYFPSLVVHIQVSVSWKLGAMEMDEGLRCVGSVGLLCSLGRVRARARVRVPTRGFPTDNVKTQASLQASMGRHYPAPDTR